MKCVMGVMYKCAVLLFGVSCIAGIQLTAYFSESGLHGEVTFEEHNGEISIHPLLQAVDEQSLWSWNVRELPVLYTTIDRRCGEEKLGSMVVNLDDIVGSLQLPPNVSAEFSIKNGMLELTGSRGLWGKSLLIYNTEDRSRRACATIMVSGGADEKVAEAKFLSPVGGSVFIHWVGSHHSGSTDTLLHVNLYHLSLNEKVMDTLHNWKIYTTDILDSEADKARENCNFLQLIFDPVFSVSEERNTSLGDLDGRLGRIKVASHPTTPRVAVYHDASLNSLSSSMLTGKRSLYLVLFDAKHHDSFLACAKIREHYPLVLKSVIQSEGIQGEMVFTQRSPFNPTWIVANLSSLTNQEVKILDYKIHEFPLMPYVAYTRQKCESTGSVFNPGSIAEDQGSGSQDTYAVGDLNGKHNMWRQKQTLSELNGQHWDVFLPLSGQHSISHRSVVLFREQSNPWICGNLVKYISDTKDYKVPIFTAEAVFRYPTVGRILFRQPQDQYWTDTTVLVEILVHSDGTSLNNTADHRWAVHELPRGKDYYDWQNRCLSAGPVYNPYKVMFDSKEPDATCSLSSVGLCRVGELWMRHGTLNIAGRKTDGKKLTRRLFTDTHLPLSGTANILGRSLVLYDDNGPKARGERLACSTIYSVYRRKAVVKDWYGNGKPTTMKGKIEFFQQTEYDITDVEMNLEGLNQNSEYHVHITPVEGSLEFPCEASSLYGRWNPVNVSSSLSPPPGLGTPDQYEMGDLSGKFGSLDQLKQLMAKYNDSNMPLFGMHSILGRSVVVHSKQKNARWACSTIERGYAPSEARELRAIASFHHPLGHAYGYIRMTQLVHNDDSKSETVIEVNLRHPGKHDRNVTRNHKWAIYVNPVGVDATVKIQSSRCVAGGYMWNPYYTQLADPLNEELYRQECGSDNPLRCYVGDISGRLGTIDLGDKRQVFTDVNFPLEGDVSAMGRSIVILAKDYGNDRFACANIEPDKDIIKYVNIRKPPRFVVAQFIDDIRDVMGLPEWMLTVDSRKTRTLHGGTCIQFLLHFKGPQANQIEQDFTRLLANGQLPQQSIYNPGYVPSSKRKTHISYRTCGSREPNGEHPGRSGSDSLYSEMIVWLTVLPIIKHSLLR